MCVAGVAGALCSQTRAAEGHSNLALHFVSAHLARVPREQPLHMAVRRLGVAIHAHQSQWKIKDLGEEDGPPCD